MSSLFNLNNYYFNSYSLAYFFSGLFVSAEGLFVYLQNKKLMVNRSFALVGLCAGIWLTGVGLMFSTSSHDIALAWSRYYSWMGIIFITPCLHLFSYAWASKPIEEQINFFRFNFLSAFVIYLICVLTPGIVERMWPFPWGFYPKAGNAHIFFLMWFAVQVYMIFRNFLSSYLKDQSSRKLQTKYITIAFVFGVFVGSVDFLANYGHQLHSVGSIGIVIFSSIIMYSIVNYKIMDIETVLHKTALWILSFSIIVVPIFFLYQMVMPHMRYSPSLQLIFGTFSFIAFAVYLREVQPKIDHFFQRRRANLEEVINRFTDNLVILKGINNLVRYIEETIDATMYANWIDIFILDEDNRKFVLANKDPKKNRITEIAQVDGFLAWLTFNNRIVYRHYIESDPAYANVRESAREYFNNTEATVAIPLVLNEKLLGIINLSRKTNLQRYKALDFQFLTTLKNQAAIAISNSLVYQNIEDEVKKRTDELVEVQRQLVQVEKMATVGTLSGGVAHEINNPLTAILTSVQMLLAMCNGESTEVDKESLELIEEATQRCRTIVQKLMTYAKKPMESGDVAKIELTDVIKKVRAFLDFQLEQENIKLVSDLGKGAFPVLGNHNELEQVITNIILNARDSILRVKKKGEIHIGLSKNNDRYRLIIKDEGVGIPENIIAQVFDPFFTTKDVGKGLGLGLSICHSIVEKHNGSIKVNSQEGQGAEFIIDLPEYSKASEPCNVLNKEK